nr:rik1-associated factor 1 [Quercus suber]
MSATVIDLTGSSPEPEESPGKILSGFLPRKNKEKGENPRGVSTYGQKIGLETTPPARIHNVEEQHVKPQPKSLAAILREVHVTTDASEAPKTKIASEASSYDDHSHVPQILQHRSLESGQEVHTESDSSSEGTSQNVGDSIVKRREQAYDDFRAKLAARRLALKHISELSTSRYSLKRSRSPPSDEIKSPKKARRSSITKSNTNFARQQSNGAPSHALEPHHGGTSSAQRLLPPSHGGTCPDEASPQTSQQGTRLHPVQMSVYSAEDDALLIRLKAEGKSWDEIAKSFPTRSKFALQTRYSTKLRERASQDATVSGHWSSGRKHGPDQDSLIRNQLPIPTRPGPISRVGWCREDDILLSKLKELDNLPWKEIGRYFPRRTHKAIEQRYSQKLRGRSVASKAGKRAGDLALLLTRRQGLSPDLTRSRPSSSSSASSTKTTAVAQREVFPNRPRRIGTKPTTEGFVSWVQADQRLSEDQVRAQTTKASSTTLIQAPARRQDRILPSTLAKIVRERTTGQLCRLSVSEELKNHVFDHYKLRRYFDGTSGDIHCLAWHPGGRRFAAGSIAVSDLQSMQYNKAINLLAGDCDSDVYELPEHHTDRPFVIDANDPASSHAMRESQDPRLFMTVSAVCFNTDLKADPNNDIMYSAGYDRKVHVYSVGDTIQHQYEIHHAANIDVLDVSRQGLLATGCTESQADCVNIFKCNTTTWQPLASLSPSRQYSSLSLFPRALRWGIAHYYQNQLLAGFSGQSNDHEHARLAGDIGLWSVTPDGTAAQIKLDSMSQSVFDVAWNPAPSSASTTFAVACARKHDVAQQIRTVVQCYSPMQLKQPTITWQCPASDINDVLYCPYDGNLLAAGATDGNVYVWDQRFVSSSRQPLHVLSHEQECLNVLPHDQDRESVDTGVRFLSWGATSSRLYSGSSDGLVRAWNPYRAPGEALVDTVATFGSAIMSGCFSPDHGDLLIGEEKGRLNLLSVSQRDKDDDDESRVARAFKLLRAEKEPDFMPESTTAEDLMNNGEIVYRPMGALPVRQAVQGPKYAGPYFAPTQEDWSLATRALQQATGEWEKLKVAQDKAQLDQDEDVDEDSLQRAANRVQVAEHRIQTLRSREMEYPAHEAQAKATQRAFLTAEDSAGSLSRCRLDCNFLPSPTDDDCGDDSNRSAQRIPDALRAMRALPRSCDGLLTPDLRVSVAGMTCSDLHRFGLAPVCPHCPLATTSQNKQFKALQERLCKARVQRLTAGLDQFCVGCGAPIIPTTDAAAAAIQRCERCNFACPRCSSPAKVSVQTSTVACETCGLSFQVGVLGYQICDEFARRPRQYKATKKSTADDDDDDDEDGNEDIGNAEREYYASLWG